MAAAIARPQIFGPAKKLEKSLNFSIMFGS